MTCRRGVALAAVVAALAGCELRDRDGTCRRTAHCSPVDAPEAACNVLGGPGQDGCAPGEKCTWIVTADGPEPDGIVGCVPAGAVPVDGRCTAGAPGATTGFDDCVAAAICVDGTCRGVCGRNETSQLTCRAGEACGFPPEIFTHPGEPALAGACGPTCDPVTQQPPCGPGQGCYLLVNQETTIALCAAAGTTAPGEAIVGPAFANSCVPGAMPRPRDAARTVVECGALCRPTDVAAGTNEAQEGGVAPATCVDRGAPAPADPVAGESCRYWHAREVSPDVSAFSNSVGWCAPHVELELPRCVELASPDAASGCVARPM